MCFTYWIILYSSIGLFFCSYQAFGCTSTTVQYKRIGDDVIIQFQATMMNFQSSELFVTNQILSNDDLPLLSALYRNGVLTRQFPCNNCTFIGNFSTGNLSIRLENIQTLNGGTYKLSVTESSARVRECVVIYILGIPTKPSISLNKIPWEGEIAVLTCISTSTTTPMDSTLKMLYDWKANNNNIHGQKYTYSLTRNMLTISNISRNDSVKQFTCTSNENITNAHTSIKSEPFHVEVYYAPSVKPFNVGPIIEGSTLKVDCKTDPGKPFNTTFSWTRKLDSSSVKSWSEIPGALTNSNQLVKHNISRNDAGLYKCTASNRFQGTADEKKLGSSSETFPLNIFYPAAIASFVVEGRIGTFNVTVDENDEGIKLECRVDGNPASTVKILFQGKTLKETVDVHYVSYTIGSVSCLDIGEYTCEGNNGIAQSTRRSIYLFVNCSPRPLDRINANISSLPHTTIMFTFTALAYPYLGAKGFSWEKENDSNWTKILPNRIFQIFSSALQTNLTILNTTRDDYGRYRLTVRNDFGTYIQHFYLAEKISDEGLNGNNILCDGCGTDKSVIVTGVSLGVVNGILIGYGVFVTVLYYRKIRRKDLQRQNKKLEEEREYANIAREAIAEGKTNASESQNERSTRNSEHVANVQMDENKQYMDLCEYSREDKRTYEELKAQSL